MRHALEDGFSDIRAKAYTNNLDDRLSKFSLSSPSMSYLDSDKLKKSRRAKRTKRNGEKSKKGESIQSQSKRKSPQD